jgi:apolipoprotein N-acyltransferase
VAWAASAGLLLGLPFAFETLQPLATVAGVPFLWLLVFAPIGRGLLYCYVAGATFIAAGCFWLVSLSPWFVAVCAGYYGLYYLPYALVPAIRRHWPTLPLWVLVPALGTFAETTREVFSAFETTWWALGYTLVRTPIAQVAEWTGVAGLSFLLLTVHAVIAEAIRLGRGGPRAAPARHIVAGAIVAVALTTTAWSWGAARRDRVVASIRRGPRALLVQGGISVEDKARPDLVPYVLDRQLAVTRTGMRAGIDLVVWAETVAPIRPETPQGAAAVRHVAAALGTPLLLGGLGVDREDGFVRHSNSAFWVSPRGELLGRYDKQALVAFGEYVPFLRHFRSARLAVGQWLMGAYPGFDPFLRPGDEYDLFALGHGGPRFAVLICYEDVLPAMTRRFARDGADFFVVLSNENFFARRELDQHADMAVLRAIETRRPILRATNTGRTCVIDPAGRITRRLDPDEEGTLEAEVPLSGTSPAAPWAQAAFGWLCGVPAGALGVLAWRRRAA